MVFWGRRFPPKNKRKQVDLRFHGSKVEFRLFVFWRKRWLEKIVSTLSDLQCFQNERKKKHLHFHQCQVKSYFGLQSSYPMKAANMGGKCCKKSLFCCCAAFCCKGKVIHPKYYKNSNKYCTFVIVGQLSKMIRNFCLLATT